MPNGYVEGDDLDALIEELDDFDEDRDEDLAERSRGRRVVRRPPTAGGGGLYRPRPQGGSEAVTQVQLEAALARVGAQIKTNSDAIGTLNTRVAAVDTRLDRNTSALRKEAAERKRTDNRLRADVRRAEQNALLLLLLSRPRPAQTIPPTTSAATLGGSAVPAGTRFVIDQSSGTSGGLDPLMLILLLGGLGGSGSGGSGESSGDQGGGNEGLLLAAALGGL